ncbi:hypothetical protein D3C77_472300 [compost metagenome]
MRIDLTDGLQRLGVIRMQRIQRLVDTIVVVRAHDRILKTFLLQRSGYLANDFCLLVKIEIASLLNIALAPPVRGRLIQWIKRAERDSPFIAEMLNHLC